MKVGQITYRVHAVERMFERGITTADVRTVVEHGKPIEDYSADTLYPSQLILGWIAKRPVHVVAAFDAAQDAVIGITAYEPDPAQWADQFRRRVV
ncbi:MAG: DUF4258 domain-containing protein [Chloroflexi bacterium]|nr:DUF4258 domain-containing protein [Chloroflexota bacterium]